MTNTPTVTPQIVVVMRGDRIAFDKQLVERAVREERLRAIIVATHVSQEDLPETEAMLSWAFQMGLRCGVEVQTISVKGRSETMPIVAKMLARESAALIEVWGEWSCEHVLFQGLHFRRPTTGAL